MVLSTKSNAPEFSLNAMEEVRKNLEDAGFADPFCGGKEQKLLLRASDPETRFRENPLRILQGVRFAVQYGMSVDPATEEAMCSQAALVDSLDRKEIFGELCGLLPLVTAEDLIRFAPVLAVVIPELKPMLGFDQRSPHHAYDLYTHMARVVAGTPADLTLRWAALLHDVGKYPTFTQDETGRGHFYGHAPKGAEMAEEILRRLEAPTALRQQVVLLIEQHMTRLQPEKKQLRRQIGRLGWETVYQLLILQEADNGSKGTVKAGEKEVYAQIRAALEEIRAEDSCLGLKDLAVNGNDLMRIGYSRKAIGDMLNRLLDRVMEETLPNERQALLAEAEREWVDAWRSS